MTFPVLKENVSSTAILSIYAHKNYLLIGESSNLLLYNIKTAHYLLKKKIFSSASIHGIKERIKCKEKKDPQFLIWGQKNFILLSLNLHNIEWKLNSEEIQIEDWIIDAIWSEDFIIIITAHNSLICYNISQLFSEVDKAKQRIPKLFEKKQCTENSLLYSGQITGLSWATCVVLCGTVFGSIHVWAPWTKSEDDSGRNAPILSLTGPKGAVFSVKYDDSTKLIAATSDDRSIRVWKLFFAEENHHSCTSINSENTSWLSCHIKQIYCSFGHSARVWRSLILNDESVLSCGEDSTICHWSPTGSLLSSWIAHPSSSIWCLTNHEDTIFSGGSDGAVKQWRIGSRSQENLVVLLPLPWKNEDSQKSIKELDLQKDQKNFPRDVCLIDPKTLVAVFDDGFVWVCHYESCQWIWKAVFHSPFLKGYVVSSVNQDSSILALGTLTGHVIILETGTWKCICQHSVSPTKIQSILFITQNQLITCTGFGKIQLWTMQYQSGMECFLSSTREYTLPSCRHPWITAASAILEENCETVCLAVGDPCGNLYLFSPEVINPKSSLRRLHGKSSITSVKTHHNVLVTTGKDGHVCYLVVKDGQIELLQTLKLSFGNWLCGIIKLGPNLIVPTFNSDKLRVWNIDEENLMAEVACGGGHRSWDLFFGTKRLHCSGIWDEIPNTEEEILLTCVFLRDGAPVIWNTQVPSTLTTIKSPTSGREIQSLKPLFVGKEGSSILFAFGGEDTLLHIHRLETGKLTKVTSIKSHLSSIRSLTRIVPLYGNSCPPFDGVYILSCGGRAQFKVWKMILTCKGIEENITMDTGGGGLIYGKEITSHMLKAESDHSWNKTSPSPDPETRYMDSLALWISKNEALFILASSDGFVRFFTYSEDNKITELHKQDCQSCIFRICIVRLKDSVYLVATTSRGSIIIWNLKVIVNFVGNMDREPYSQTPFETIRYQVQKAGLNSIAVNEEAINEEYLHLVVGGEDGSIHLLSFSYMIKENHSQHPLHIDICSKVCLHAAKVSGLAWLNETHLCSASVDQRLIIWRIESNNLIPLSVHFSLPDIQDIYFFSSNKSATGNTTDENDSLPLVSKLFVYGKGLEVFDVS